MSRETIPSRRPVSGAEPRTHGSLTDPRKSVKGGPARLIENLAFFAILLIVSMRPLLSETYDSGLSGISRAVGDATSLTPATTAVFDLVIWVAAIVAAIAHLLQRRSWRWTGIEIGWLLAVAAAAISSWAASNQRLAINASCDWLTAMVLAMTLANLLYERRRLVLVLAVLVATGLTSAVKCGTQKAWEFDDTWQAYQETKQQFWAGQGVSLTDPTVELFERRLLAREATGFLSYTNAQAAGLALAGFAAIAAAMLTGPRRDLRWVAGAVAGILFAAIILTGSRGGLAAAAMGLAVCLVLWWIRRVLQPDRTWRRIWLAVWLTALAGTLFVVGWGKAKGLPGDSLRFRWEYWRITSRIIADHPLTGVGALNFDRAYLLHKPVAYPEEIRDPHSFLMAILAQWGVPGGIGLLAALLGGSWVALRRWGQDAESPTLVAGSAEPAEGSLNRWIAALVVGFISLRLWMLRGWLQSGEDGVAAALFDLGIYGVAWAIAFPGLCLLLASATTARPSGSTSPPYQGGASSISPPYQGGARGGSGYRLACLIGLAVFLLHNTIDFSLFVPGTLTTFAVVVAIALAGSQEQGARVAGRGPGGRKASWPLIVSVGGLFAMNVLFVVPVVRCVSCLNDARTAASTGSGDPGRLYAKAAAADPLDPTPLTEWALWAGHVGGRTGLDKALACLQAAEERDPLDRGIYRSRWQILQLRYQVTRNVEDLLQAVPAARRAVELYPELPDGHVDLARLLAKAATGAESDLSMKAAARVWEVEAVMHYCKALDLDAARPSYEIRRWSADQRRRIEGELAQLKIPAGSAPAG